jgi:ribosomal protein S18 acetylase RimI-like enzyme
MVSHPQSLTSEHDLTHFDCGKEPLNSWLKKHALQSPQSGQSKTMVVTEASDSKIVVGYCSYNVVSVEHTDSTPERVKKGLARHPIPIFLIARLARDKKYKGVELGRRLLRHALKRAASISDLVPIRAIVVDAIDERAIEFYSDFDFEPFPADSLRMWLLLKDLLKTIKFVEK